VEVLANSDLYAINTLALPCIADFKLVIDHPDELFDAIAFADEKDLPWLVLGQGSNVVLPLRLHAVVIYLNLLGVEVTADSGGLVNVNVCAGEPWHTLVENLLQQNIFGLENLALIPGLAGAAPVQNIGAYGREIADFIDSVEVYDIERQEIRHLSRSECDFSYRSSIFKTTGTDRYIITALKLSLSTSDDIDISYHALATELKAIIAPTARNVFDAVVSIRSSKLPNPAIQPNAGSFFKNPIVTAERYWQLLETYPNLVAYPQTDGMFKLAAAWLIDNAGWKGKVIGPVATHSNQALVLINLGAATSDDILTYAAALSSAIEDLYKVTLQREPVAYSANCLRLA
jgi:UDP-N-acetylmuramate dehydrogenase